MRYPTLVPAMLATYDPIFVWGNYLEACLWSALAVFAFFKAPAGVRTVLVAALVAFGFSDVVEVQTGAWYRPGWLLVWKTACVQVLAGVGLWDLRSARARLKSGPKGELRFVIRA